LRLTRLKRVASGGAALVLAAGVCTVIGLSGALPAGAVNNNPAGNPTSPAVSYELDCAGTGAAAGQTAPFVAATVINTTTDTGLPTGTTFGATGSVSLVLSGALLAPLNAALNPATVSLQGGLTFGSTNGSATGTYSYTSPTMTAANPGGAVTNATWASGSSTISGNFTAADVGQFVAISPLGTATGIPNGSVISSVVPGVSASIAPTLTTAANATATTVGLAPAAGITFTDPTPLNTGNVFTTAGTVGGTSRIGVTGSSGFTLTATLAIGFTPCSPSGFFGATPVGTPLFPAGSTTGYESATAPPAGAFVNLTAATGPTCNNQTVALGEGGTGSVTLSASAGSYPVSSTGFSLPGGSPQTIPLTPGPGTLTVTQSAAGSPVINLSNTSTVAASGSFTFQASDTLAAANGGPLHCATPGTITVQVGTPPVVQPFSEQVNGAQLVLSCNSPANYVTGNNTPTPVGTPLLQCPEFQFQPITLDGLEQEVSASTGETNGTPSGTAPGTIYISDNRGSPTGTWTLTGTFVPTAIGTGNGQNPNASCAGIDAFCNSSVGAAALNTTKAGTGGGPSGAHDGQIAPNYLQVNKITCIADPTGGITGPDGTVYNPPNLNPNANPTAGGNFGAPVQLCTATSGQSGGTFLFNATYTLIIPESVYAGNYFGSVQYTVA
jgi:hypothetical protein